MRGWAISFAPWCWTLAFLFLWTSGAISRAADDSNWDSEFSTPSLSDLFTPRVKSLAVLWDGSLAVANDFPLGLPFVHAGTRGVTRWDGLRWTSLADITTKARVLLSYDRNLVAAGSFHSIRGVAATNISRWDGTNWHALGAGLDGGAITALAYGNGTLYAGGGFTNSGSESVRCVAAWDGAQWKSLGLVATNTNSIHLAVGAMASSGSNLFVAGTFLLPDATNTQHLARWNGESWSTLSDGTTNAPNPPIRALTVDHAGRLYAGVHTLGSVDPQPYVAVWDGTSWSRIGGLTRPSLGAVLSLYHDGGDLWAAGNFIRAGEQSTWGVARWDGQRWHPVTDLIDFVAAIVVGRDGRVFFQGTVSSPFDSLEAGYGIVEFDGNQWRRIGSGLLPDQSSWAVAARSTNIYVGGSWATVPGAARWDGQSWTNMQGLAGPGTVHGFALSDGKVYAVGKFSAAGPGGIAVHDGAAWNPLGAGLPATGLAIELRGSEIFAGHQEGISRWNGGDWSSLGDGLDGAVRALAARGTNLYAGGSFSHSGALPLNRIARWDGTAWHPLAQGLDGPVHALEFYGNTLYVAGAFSQADGQSASRIASWDGQAWSSWTPLPTRHFPSILALAVRSDGVLYAGGEFGEFGEPNPQGVARWDGAQWSSLGTQAPRNVRALAIEDDNLYVGGEFLGAGFCYSPNFARWLMDDPPISVMALAPVSVERGSPIEYSITVANPGPETGEGFVEVAIPRGLGDVTPSDGGVVADGTIQWPVAGLRRGQRETRGFAAVVNGAERFLSLDDCRFRDSRNRLYLGQSVFTSVTSTGLPPLLKVLAPLPGTVFSNLANVPIELAVATQSSAVLQVDIFQGASPIAALRQPPYAVTLTNLRAGAYLYTAVATDSNGKSSTVEISFQVARPANDGFENRIALTGSKVAASGFSNDATVEPDEPDHASCCKVRTLWWSWVSPDDGVIAVHARGGSLPPLLGIYSGNALTDLFPVGFNKKHFQTESPVFMPVRRGVEYQIVLDGGYPIASDEIGFELELNRAPVVSVLAPADGESFAIPLELSVEIAAVDPELKLAHVETFLGPFSLGTNANLAQLNLRTPLVAGGSFAIRSVATDRFGQHGTSRPVNVVVELSNDRFSNRVSLIGREFVAYGSTAGALLESGEEVYNSNPAHAGSVWFEWQPSIAGFGRIVCDWTEPSAAFELFRGASFDALNSAGRSSNDPMRSELQFPALEGAPLVIRVSGSGGRTEEGFFRISGHIDPIPPIVATLIPPLPGKSNYVLRVTGPLWNQFSVQSTVDFIEWRIIPGDGAVGPFQEILLPVTEAPYTFYRVTSEAPF